MRNSKWYCRNCDQTSTRHWNLKIHIQRKHSGLGEPVRAVTFFNFNSNIANNYGRQIHKEREDPIDKANALGRKLLEHKNILQLLSGNGIGSGNPGPSLPNVICSAKDISTSVQAYIYEKLTKAFGYRFEFCDVCLVLNMHPVCYPDNRVDETDTIVTHICTPEHIIAANKIRSNGKNHSPSFNNLALEFVKTSLIKLPTNSFNHLTCISLDHQPEKGIIKLTNPLNSTMPLIFSTSKEGIIQIDLDPHDKDAYNQDNRWLTNAISKGTIRLSDNELLQFLTLVRTATFAFFKVRIKESLNHYFMKLSGNTLEK